jgi:DNA (cytosine-5)-methyltransferase 1
LGKTKRKEVGGYLRHIDLFSGIGGFALAAQEVWGDEYENFCFCEINKYAQAVLRKQFGKDARIYGDIRGLTADTHKQAEPALRVNAIPGEGMPESSGVIDASDPRHSVGRPEQELKQTERPEVDARSDGPRVDLLTGGFPCQPFSQAGKRKGTNDDRYLWPEMLRVIHEFKPTWVVAENVRGLLTISEGVVFEQVCADLEGEGYEVQPFVIPACAVNAPHRRDRVWIVGHLHGARRHESAVGEILGAEQSSDTAGDNSQDELGASPHHQQGRKQERARYGRLTCGERSDQGASWNQNWLEVATRFCGVDDGLPGEMDGVTLTKAGHRVERLKGLGNAIVPQVAMEIMQAIRTAMNHV